MNDFELSEYLASEAIRLTDAYFRLPIPIGRLSYEQGMIIERQHGIGDFKAYMTLPKQRNDWAKVVLPHRRSSTIGGRATAYDRFCVAHELAHLLIFRKAGIIPSGNTMYWKHEAICDKFARDILVPPRFFESLPISNSLSMVDKLRIDANVPWMVVARQVTTKIKNLAFFIIKISTEDHHQLYITSSSMPNHKARGSRVAGLLSIKISKMIDSKTLNNEWSLAGDTIIESNIGYVDREKDYILRIQRDREFRERMYLSIEEIV